VGKEEIVLPRPILAIVHLAGPPRGLASFQGPRTCIVVFRSFSACLKVF
jgi:hypothetical protein